MQKFITCLLLAALLGMIPILLSAQQNQSTQKSDLKIEVLENRVSELEKQLQTVENVEKLDLQAKLAEANAKLANAEFGKFERGLKDSNDERMRNWVILFLAIVSTAGVAFWFVVKSLIVDRVEKNLNGFKEALKESGILKNQLEELEEAVVVSMLESTFEPDLGSELGFPEENKVRREEALKELREEPLLKIFANEEYHIAIRHRAAEVLAKKSPPLVAPALQLLNSTLDSDVDIDSEASHRLRSYLGVLAYVHTQETYQGLTDFLIRLLTENPRHKDLFLTWTVFSLAWVSIKLNIGDSVPILKMAIPHLKVGSQDHQALQNLARQFDIFNDPAGIKEILVNHVTSERSSMEDVEDKCLELLQKHDPEFVNEWQARETTDNSNA